MFANTDIHEPAAMAYDFSKTHRPMTLVFARSRTDVGIREALFVRLTVAYFNNTLAGGANLLEPLFFSSLKMNNPAGKLRFGETKRVSIENNSDIDYEL